MDGLASRHRAHGNAGWQTSAGRISRLDGPWRTVPGDLPLDLILSNV